MVVVLHDIYPGPDQRITQIFGVNAATYARFGLQGHDGVDFGLPSGTPVLSATDGRVVRVGTDLSGYGLYVEVWDPGQQCATLYGHLGSIVVALDQVVHNRQRLGLSDNTGFSSGPHLHFGLCFTDANGFRLNRTNGFAGWVDPDLAANAHWDTNGQEFVPPPPPDPCGEVKAQLARWEAWVATAPKGVL